MKPAAAAAPAPSARQFLVRTALFCALLVAGAIGYVATFGTVMRLGKGRRHDLAGQIRQSTAKALARDYDVVVLGNSRLYRGRGPTYVRRPTYSFAFDDDTLMYYRFKCRWLRANGKRPRAAVVGLDYFQLGYWTPCCYLEDDGSYRIDEPPRKRPDGAHESPMVIDPELRTMLEDTLRVTTACARTSSPRR